MLYSHHFQQKKSKKLKAIIKRNLKRKFSINNIKQKKIIDYLNKIKPKKKKKSFAKDKP